MGRGLWRRGVDKQLGSGCGVYDERNKRMLGRSMGEGVMAKAKSVVD